MTENSEQLSSKNIFSDSPLGIKNPLLSRSPLGQKFLQPLGSRSISVLNLSLFSDKEGKLQRFSDWESPFLVKSKPDLGFKTIIQEKPLSPLSNNPFKATELHSDQVSNIESDFSETPTNYNLEADIHTLDKPQIRQKLAPPSEKNNESKKNNPVSPTKPSSSKVKPSKSTLFRAIIGDNSPSSKQNSFPQVENKPSSNLNSEQNINLSSFESDSPIIQEQTETYNLEQISSRIDSPNSPQIQRESESSTPETHSELPQTQQPQTPIVEKTSSGINSPNSPQIQRETESSTPENPNTITSDSSPQIQRKSKSILNQSNFINEKPQTVRELLSDGNLPEIQGVFKNLASHKRLTSQQTKNQENQYFFQNYQASIQAKTSTSSPKSRNSVPDAWSNIEELMGEAEKPKPDSNRKKSPNLNPQQSRLEKPPKSQLLPDSTQVSPKGEVQSAQFENQPSPIKKLMQKTLANRGKLKEEVSARKGHQVHPLKEQDLYALEENVNAQNIAQVQKQDESKEEVITSEHLEELAREIYSAICQRFQVERERYGFNNFSNRLPW